ncbi:class I adenylate-forming enzyme family protein [Pseudonocardia endophytica]|uniref:Acyl-CoA synthetase (AMP-forming)/AMP-acid ligase II n=1 Tax=Pseudonocardia endophytica TaxID=401976 RepID=A0A4V6NDF2_PSEEN|nr:AMP-binding protein [Pseudonocardia endophytica]TCK21986.1 acyl-CoA synthetase (AMP-forming)/AMP-acid ligase II [Pseudonocardia endophytica]
MNLTLLLDMAADTAGDRVAVGPADTGATYADVRDAAAGVAGALTRRGAQRLVLASQNTDAIPGLLFGAALAGVPFTSVNYRLADDRLVQAMERCSPAVVVADERTAPRIDGVAGLELRTATELAAEPPAGGAPADDADAVAVSLFTSGTSGAPKSVVLRHRNLTSYILSTTEFLDAGEDEAALVSVPPYHIAGIASVLSNVYSGRRLVYLPQFDPHRWVELARTEAVTHAMIVPTMLGRILDVLEETGTPLPALRHLSYGGGRMPLPVVRRALTLLPDVGFVNAYGLTETSSTIALLGPDDHRDAFVSDDPAVAARLGSVGRAVPGVELEIHGTDGRPVECGRIGEIVVRGDQIAGEYQGSDAKDADGWFRTNDRGWLDDAGYLFVDGRADDVIVRGGENLSPGEIEDVLVQHPDVAEAAVVGVPDEEWGETVAAVVVARDGRAVDADALRAFVSRSLRSSRAPTVVAVRDALPYNDTGKLLRRELRDAFAVDDPRTVTR